jgi:hypothetical protein
MRGRAGPERSAQQVTTAHPAVGSKIRSGDLLIPFGDRHGAAACTGAFKPPAAERPISCVRHHDSIEIITSFRRMNQRVHGGLYWASEAGPLLCKW